MLVLLIVAVRDVALVLRGHRELVLENVALRQQLAAMKRAQKRVPLNTRDRHQLPSRRFTVGAPWSSKGLDDLISAQGTRRPLMRMFDVQGIEITASRHKIFEFLRDPANLPRWAHAFVSAGNGRAR